MANLSILCTPATLDDTSGLALVFHDCSDKYKGYVREEVRDDKEILRMMITTAIRIFFRLLNAPDVHIIKAICDDKIVGFVVLHTVHRPLAKDAQTLYINDPHYYEQHTAAARPRRADYPEGETGDDDFNFDLFKWASTCDFMLGADSINLGQWYREEKLPYTSIMAIGVVPGMQCRGVGRMLMEHATKRADSEGQGMMLLLRGLEEGSIAFFERFGFAPSEKPSDLGSGMKMFELWRPAAPNLLMWLFSFLRCRS